MANLGMNYDPNAFEPDTGRRDPFPEGRYVLQVIDTDVVDTQKGGKLLKATVEVFDGEYKGRRLFENFNIQNNSQIAQEIAMKQLSALCKAAGINGPIADSYELHHQPFEADVGIEPESTVNGKTYAPRNNIKKYHFEGAAPAAKAAPRPAPRPAAAPARPATGTRPWERQKQNEEIPF